MRQVMMEIGLSNAGCGKGEKADWLIFFILMAMVLPVSCVIVDGSPDDDEEEAYDPGVDGDSQPDQEGCGAAVDYIYQYCQATMETEGGEVTREDAYAACLGNEEWICVFQCLEDEEYQCINAIICLGTECTLSWPQE